ncbi:hypothetical protein ZWY2020_006243 [Hordeum vulgare]|nr:hypothetical protein ZWY2020_006243 [Hordeum vulgare]
MRRSRSAVIASMNSVYAMAKKFGGHLQIPITNQYCFEMFIICGLRSVIEEYVHRIEPDAIPGEMKMWTPDFVTREGLQYEAIIEFGGAGSKITGGGWKQLMDDYAVRPGHIMYMYLRNGGHKILVDFKADGVQLSPLFFVAMRGLSRTKAKLIGRCIYARGIRLQHHEMKILIESSFGPTKYPFCVFVNRMSNRDATGGYMEMVSWTSSPEYIHSDDGSTNGFDVYPTQQIDEEEDSETDGDRREKKKPSQKPINSRSSIKKMKALVEGLLEERRALVFYLDNLDREEKNLPHDVFPGCRVYDQKTMSDLIDEDTATGKDAEIVVFGHLLVS